MNLSTPINSSLPESGRACPGGRFASSGGRRGWDNFLGSNGRPSTIRSSITADPEELTATKTFTSVALSMICPVPSGTKNLSMPNDSRPLELMVPLRKTRLELGFSNW